MPVPRLRDPFPDGCGNANVPAIASAKAATRHGCAIRDLSDVRTLHSTISPLLIGSASFSPEAQIETAAGHAGEGTNKRNYRHLRPDYLAELIDAVESL
jgi:hypothetical protein